MNPDTPQKRVRLAVLEQGKTLVTPQPRLRTGFFSTLHKDRLEQHQLREACTSAGVRKHGAPVSLDDSLKVGLVVVGSVAVNPSNGCRIGKGEVSVSSCLAPPITGAKQTHLPLSPSSPRQRRRPCPSSCQQPTGGDGDERPVGSMPFLLPAACDASPP